jgi:hypothetical protein
MIKRETKTPIKTPPLRQPGQSLREHIMDVANDQLWPLIMMMTMTWMWAILEWCGTLFHLPRHPWIYTLIAACCTGYAYLVKLPKIKRELRNYRRGEEGEAAVGQLLEEKLRPMGYHIFHDIPAEGFNLDHVAIGPAGVLCIETKTYGKPISGQTIISFEQGQVLVNGYALPRNPIEQAKGNAKWLMDIMEEMTAHRFLVQPVVVFPGWCVDFMPQGLGAWVLNETVLPNFLAKQKTKLEPADIALLKTQLKLYVTTRQRLNK